MTVLDKTEKLSELGEQIGWFPAHMGKRYANWVEGLDWDWPISRQRFFGVPFPVWVCEGCEHVFTAPEEWLPVLEHSQHEVGSSVAVLSRSWPWVGCDPYQEVGCTLHVGPMS